MSFDAQARQLSTVASIAIVGIALGAALGFRILERRGARAEASTSPRLALDVPHVDSAVQIDGELTEVAWAAPGRTGGFLKDSRPARPYSDVRAVWRDGTLYLALYAADEDIVAPLSVHDAPTWTGDAFQLVFRTGDVERTVDVSPRGTVTDGARVGGGAFDPSWESHAVVAVDRDGTLDDRSDTDEEWIVELALPLASLGLSGLPGERIGFEVRRCDQIHDRGPTPRRACASWGDHDSELILR